MFLLRRLPCKSFFPLSEATVESSLMFSVVLSRPPQWPEYTQSVHLSWSSWPGKTPSCTLPIPVSKLSKAMPLRFSEPGCAEDGASHRGLCIVDHTTRRLPDLLQKAAGWCSNCAWNARNVLRVTNSNVPYSPFLWFKHCHVCASHLVPIFSQVSTLAADMNRSRSLLKHTQWIIGLNMLIWDNSWTILEQRRNGQDFISPIFSHPLISSDVEMTLGKLSWAFNHTGVCSCQGSSVCRVERQGRSLILGQWSSPSELVTVSLR